MQLKHNSKNTKNQQLANLISAYDVHGLIVFASM